MRKNKSHLCVFDLIGVKTLHLLAIVYWFVAKNNCNAGHFTKALLGATHPRRAIFPNHCISTSFNVKNDVPFCIPHKLAYLARKHNYSSICCCRAFTLANGRRPHRWLPVDICRNIGADICQREGN